MSDKIQDNKFKEELEKELHSGFHTASDESESDDHDFTVKVKREEYIVRRRFYDKDKALEEAETLRKDKRNLVEDNIEGQAFSVEDDDDETVDWDKLVDAGLEFDPPIAQAAEKKPGEPPVGLAEQVDKPRVDNQVLEKTMLVKRPPIKAPQIEEPDENVEFEGENDKKEVVEMKSKTVWIVIAVLVVCVGAGTYFVLSNRARSDKPQVFKVESNRKINKTAFPVHAEAPPVNETVKKMPVRDDEAKPQAADQPVTETSQPPVTEAEPPVRTKIEQPAPVVTDTKPAEPVKKPEPPAPAKTVVTVEDHYTHTVHVSSYRSQERALAAVTQLKKKGYKAFTGITEIPGKGQWYRVYAGYLQDLDTALEMSERIKKEMHESAVARKLPMAIQVGDTALLTDLESLLSKLDQKGYAANAVPVAKDSDMGRVLIDAFKYEKEAETMLSILKKDGFSAKVVQR